MIGSASFLSSRSVRRCPRWQNAPGGSPGRRDRVGLHCQRRPVRSSSVLVRAGWDGVVTAGFLRRDGGRSARGAGPTARCADWWWHWVSRSGTGRWVAIVELASMAGWMAYDVDDHNAARRLWTYALDTARRAEDHPGAPDLAVDVLLDMAHQALHLYGVTPGPTGLGHGRKPRTPGQHDHPGLHLRRARVVPGRARRGRAHPPRHRQRPGHLRRRRPGHDPPLGGVRQRRRDHRPAGPLAVPAVADPSGIRAQGPSRN